MTAIRALRHIDSDDMPWRRQAACIATGPATFYPERDGNDVVADIVRAKVICASCPVQADCRIVDAPVHNYSTYCNRGCRCEVCTEGMRTWRELRHG